MNKKIMIICVISLLLDQISKILIDVFLDVNEVIASYKNDSTESKTVYATEKLLPKLIFNVDAVTDDTGTYAGPTTYYKDDITSSTIYSEYPTGIIPKVEGNEDFGFAGVKATWKGYDNASLAIQDLINGNVNLVIIDSAPADAVTKAMNATA